MTIRIAAIVSWMGNPIVKISFGGIIGRYIMLRIAGLGIGCRDGYILSPAVNELSGRYEIELTCGDAVSLDADPELLGDFLEKVGRCDFMLIRVHGDVSYFRHFRELTDTLAHSECSAFLVCSEPGVTEEYRSLFRQGDGDFLTLRRLEEIGGDENQRSAVLWALNTFAGACEEIPEPTVPPAQGIYVPDAGYVPLGEGMRKVGGKGRPVIAVFFHQKYFLTHSTSFVDGLCRCMEERGAEPVAVFVVSSPNPLTGSIGLRRVIDEYLMKDGEPLVDCVVNTMGFSQTLIADPGCGTQKTADNFFARLNVPVIQAITLYSDVRKWEESPFGLSPADIAMGMVNPEYDGQIDTVPVGGVVFRPDGSSGVASIPERCRMVADTAFRWASLRHIPDSEKKVAVIIYMYPPRQDLAGGGYGLDTMQSVSCLLHRMKDAGYSLDWVPADGKELTARLLDGVTNDDSWKSDAQIRAAAADMVPPETYRKWFDAIDGCARRRMVEGWGDPPGDIHVLGGKQLLPGIMNGNVFIGFQPDRGKTTSGAYHDAWTAPPHQYLGFYRWLRDVWKADAAVHVGTHGTLEWLPGKSAGLSGGCDPDIVLGNIPNINPYIIDNPGEGMQAKRRSYAVVTTHMIPAMVRSGGYEEINALETAVQAFLKAEEYGQEEKTVSIAGEIASMCGKMGLTAEAGLTEDPTPEEVRGKADALYDYILEVKDAMIKDGLHILGDVPEDRLMAETVYTLVRSANGDVPSLRDSAAAVLGWDMEDLLKDPSGTLPGGMLKGEASDAADAGTFRLIETMQETDFSEKECLALPGKIFGKSSADLEKSIRFVCRELVPSLRLMGDELTNILRALGGEFILPGPSGCPNRGRAQILPTGRNFYSIDPDGIPWNSSWETGSAMAEQMVDRCVKDGGTYPRTVAVVLWATDTMKTGGDDVAYILRLMGLRPVWAEYGGRVKDLEVIPLSELKRPRVDVVLRISGLFRDTFPNLVELIDRGADRIAALDEEDEDNALAAHLRRDVADAIASGVPADEARRAASVRIFGDAPGQYGCGVSDAVETGEWETVGDLADIYVKHGCYVYGSGLQGEARPDLFRKRLGETEVTVKNHNTRAVDMLDMDDDMDSLGGLNAAVEAVRGTKPVSFMGDSSDTRNLKLRTAAEEIRFVYRSKVDNPKWLEGLKRHGFAGAKELSKLFVFTLGWSATSGIADGRMYRDLAERFVLDGDTREWVKDENPYAMTEMLKRLDEAMERGFWDASDEMKEKLKEVYMEFEERIEEITDR